MYDAQKKKRDIQREVHEDGVWTPTCCMHDVLKQAKARRSASDHTCRSLLAIDRSAINDLLHHAAAFEGGSAMSTRIRSREQNNGWIYG